MAQLYFKYGAMGSSKTANALMARFNYEERGQKTLLVKPRRGERRFHSIRNTFSQGMKKRTGNGSGPALNALPRKENLYGRERNSAIHGGGRRQRV